jgi:23S rRNA (pseudouridine1915-N3)-methyltransferase
MRLVIAAVGRLKDEGERALIARYMKRVASGRAIGLSPVIIEELSESRAAETNARQADESARLLHVTADCDLRIVLDERGRMMSSAEFAQYLGARRDEGVKAAALLIGGPDGHPASLTGKGTHLTLSLGCMTLPHGLARVVLIEQIYRAITILSGHPYHRA